MPRGDHNRQGNGVMGKASNSAKPLDPARDLWEQQDDESEEAYESFVRYRNLGRGNRSLEAVAHELNKSKALMGRWSRMWSWRARVVEYDRHMDRRSIEEKWDEIDRMSKRHAQGAQIMQRALIGPATAILQVVQDRPTVFREYFMDEEGIVDFNRLERVMGMVVSAARILPQVVGMERLAMGEPTEITEERADPRHAAHQFLDDAETREVAQQFFARMNGTLLPSGLEESEPGDLPTDQGD